MAMEHELTDLFTVSSEETSLRLDKLLVSRFPKYSRTYFQFLIEQGCVLASGEPVKKRAHLDAGDEVEICFLLTPELSLTPQEIPLDILYEDEHLIGVNKPVGMVVHPAPGHPDQTFANALLFHCQHLPGNDPLRPGIVHRLDKDTSGVLLAAKTSQAHGKLVEMFSKRELKKKYLALCVGTPKEGWIDAPIGRHPVHRKEMCVLPEGKEAKTFCRVLQTKNGLSLVEVDLVTGRTHQIRVHLKHIGAPVLGDPVYGSASVNKKFNTTRQLLHAHTLSFTHPITGKPLELTAPLPADFMAIAEL